MSTPVTQGRSLSGRTSEGVVWIGGAQVIGQGIHLIVRLILARLLAPEDFGLVAIAMIFISLSLVLTELGLGPALIHRDELKVGERSTAFWCSVGSSSCLVVVLWMMSPSAAAFFGRADVAPVLRALSLALVLGAPETVYAALLRRDFDFATIGLRRVVGRIFAGSVAVTAAANGLGVWSLVIYTLLESFTGSALLAWKARWRPRFQFSVEAAREFWSYGRWLLGSRMMNFLNRNADNALIGRFIGADALGLYALSYQAVVQPLNYFSRPVAFVALPAFSEIKHDRDRCRRAYLRGLRLVLLAIWPVTTLAVLAAPTGIPLVIGDKWSSAIVPLQILSVVAALQAHVSLSNTLFQGVGRPDLVARMTAIGLTLNLVGFVGGLPWGIRGVAMGYLGAVALSTPIHLRFVARVTNLRVSDIAECCRNALVTALTAGIAWVAASVILLPAEDILRFCGNLTVAAGALLLAAVYLRRDIFSQLRAVLSTSQNVSGPVEPTQA